MIVLGVDPSTVATGWGVLEGDSRGARVVDSGVLRPPTRSRLAERLVAIHAGLLEVIDEVAPEVVVIESVFPAETSLEAFCDSMSWNCDIEDTAPN